MRSCACAGPSSTCPLCGLMAIPPETEDPALHAALLAKLARRHELRRGQHRHERRLRGRGPLRCHACASRHRNLRRPRPAAAGLRRIVARLAVDAGRNALQRGPVRGVLLTVQKRRGSRRWSRLRDDKNGGRMIKHLAIGAVIAMGASSAAQAQDAAAGEKVFARCKACHVVDGEQNKVGPHLSGIVGRKVAAVEGYKYSSAMTEGGRGGQGLGRGGARPSIWPTRRGSSPAPRWLSPVSRRRSESRTSSPI